MRSNCTPHPRLRMLTAGLAALASVCGALIATVSTPPAAQATGGNCVDQALTRTCTFAYTGAAQFWTVPSWVLEADFEVLGAAGGKGWFYDDGKRGGVGGGVRATVSVVPGATMQINVGGKGASLTGAGGWNGGGNGASEGSPYGGGGGGASDIRVAPYSLADRLVVGGGGGGGGSKATWITNVGSPGKGGAGGGANPGGGVAPGSPGQSSEGSNTFTAGGGSGGGTDRPGYGGGASGGVMTGCSGLLGTALPGRDGSAATGGSGGHLHNTFGSDCFDTRGWGGGGGGGYFGGGGGGGGIDGGAGGGGGSGYGPAGSTSFQGELDTHGAVRVTFLRRDTGGGWVRLGGDVRSAPGASAQPGSGTQDVFYLDVTGRVVHRSIRNGVVGPEEGLGGPRYAGSSTAGPLVPGSSVASVSWMRGRIDIFGRGLNNALWHKSYDGATWSGWEQLGGEQRLFSSPTVSSFGPGRLDVFGLDQDDKLMWMSFSWGSPWTGWQPLGQATLATPPAAVAWDAGHRRISVYAGFVSSVGVSLMVKEWDGQGWSPWQPFSGTTAVTSAAAVSASGYGEGELYVRNAGNGLTSNSYRSGVWTGLRDRGSVGSPPGFAPAVNALYTNQTVFVRGTDNALWARIEW